MLMQLNALNKLGQTVAEAPAVLGELETLQETSLDDPFTVYQINELHIYIYVIYVCIYTCIYI